MAGSSLLARIDDIASVPDDISVRPRSRRAVKLDDAGLYLSNRRGAGGLTDLQRHLGQLLFAAAPWLIKALSVVGTAAMFLVGGSILAHGLPGAHELVHALAHTVEGVPGVGGPFLGRGDTAGTGRHQPGSRSQAIRF